MKIIKIALAVLVILALGAVIYFAMADITVEQKEVIKEIPNARFSQTP